MSATDVTEDPHLPEYQVLELFSGIGGMHFAIERKLPIRLTLQNIFTYGRLFQDLENVIK